MFSAYAGAETEENVVRQRFGKYISHLISGEYDLAGTLWLPEFTYQVYKFGISYPGSPVKFDCNSPLILRIDDYRNGIISVSFDIVSRAIGEYVIILKINDGSNEELYKYTMIRGEDDRFYLVPRYWPIMGTMKTLGGKYYKLYYFKDWQINDSAVAAVDYKIGEIAARLGIGQDARDRLAADKIIYILCENAIQVRELTGISDQGYSDPTSNFIISSYLPHSAALTDFLITYKLRECPLFTLPFMEKGLQVFLGGRAGARLSVFGQLVDFSLESDFLKLEDILVASEFSDKTGGPDFAYALSAYFMGYLLDRLGMDDLLSLYLRFSGDDHFIDTCSLEMVKEHLKKGTGMKWNKLEKKFLSYFDTVKEYGIYPCDDKPDGEVVYQSGTAGFSVTVYEKDKEYIVDARAFEDSSFIYAALLFERKSSQYKAGYQSSLFKKHFPSRDYSNQFYGIIFNRDEAGTYNSVSYTHLTLPTN